VGHKRGRAAVVEFVRDSSAMIERISLAVHDVLASEARAIIVGALSTRIKATGKSVETPYAIVLTMADALITEFLMLEDSFAVALAARA
jgi:ketosteroid isomerase-like protein